MRAGSRKVCGVFALFLHIAIFSSWLYGQQTVNNASLEGRVTDASGAVVEDVAVTARQVATGLLSSSTTGGDGRFRFPYLAVGQYEVSVQKQGFAMATRVVNLSLGAAFDLPVMLSVGTTSSSITVNAMPPMLETDRSQVAGTILQSEVTNLPFNGRNFLDLALLVPGVSPTNTAANQLFAETSAVPGQGISVNSQRNFSNSFIVDGLSANDDAAGLVQTSFGLDVIREMQVVTSGGQAEFGRALGGYLNFVTRSGTNQLHGSAYAFLRNHRLNADNALSQANLPLTQAQYGASLGGPVVHNRTFYFANFEQRQLNQDGIITITPINAAAINARLQAIGYQGQLLRISSNSPTTLYPNPVRSSNFFAKLDHQLTNRDMLNVRYSLYHVTSDNSRGAGGTSYTSAAAGVDDLDQTVAVSNIFTLSNRTVNETRGQFTNSNLKAPVNDPIGPAVSISGVASFGTLSASPTARYDRLYEVVDNISHETGPHALRAGADFLYNDLKITYPQSIRGSYSFSSLNNFLNGTYTNSGFTQSFGNPVVPQTNPNIGFYGQDEWKVRPSLTLNAGVRYDLQFLKTIATDYGNVSPRFGFAWTPSASRKTVVRGSFGLFYDRIPLRALSNALESSNNTTNITPATFFTVSVSPTQMGAPVFPGTLSVLPSGVLPNFTTMNPHMQNAYSEQTALEIEQQLTPTSTFSINYQHVRGLHLLISVNQNTPTCAASGSNNGCRPNPAYGNDKEYEPSADSYYDGLSVSYLQRPVRWGSYRVSYTWSKAIDDVSEFFFSSPINNFDLAEDRSLSDDDQRNRVVFDATAHTSLEPASGWMEKLTHGFLLGGILQYYSATPFNVVTGANSIQGTTQRPCVPGIVICTNVLPGTVIGRNAGRGFDFFNMSARLSRSVPIGNRFRLEGIAEAFNALNHRNDEIPNTTFGTGVYPIDPLPTFGKATAVGDPRNIQLALRLTF